MASDGGVQDQGRLPLRLLRLGGGQGSAVSGRASGWRGRSRVSNPDTARRAPGRASRGAAPRPHFPAPASLPTRFFPDRCPSHSVSRFHPTEMAVSSEKE